MSPDPIHPLDVRFVRCQEVRMGSPYQCCDLEVDGDWEPDLPADLGYQNVTAESPGRRYRLLIAWDIGPTNEPAFRIFVADGRERRVRKSSRVEGCVQRAGWDPAGSCFRLQVWLAGNVHEVESPALPPEEDQDSGSS